MGWQNFARISRSFKYVTRDRQTYNKQMAARQTTDSRQMTDEATETEGSHTKSEPNKLKALHPL